MSRRIQELIGRHGHVTALLATCLAIGCATPEARYGWLSFFFDGVPIPESMRPPESVVEAPSEGELLGAAPTVAGDEWVIHEPDCEECHSSKEKKLPYADPPELCWDCHDEEDFTDEVKHGPFAAGACVECHSPHKSQHESLLVSPVPELCLSCHDATNSPELEEHEADEGEDCIECHNPHAGPADYMLEAAVHPLPMTGAPVLAQRWRGTP